MAWTLHRLSVASGTYTGLLSGGDGAEPPALRLLVGEVEVGNLVPAAAEGGGWRVEGEIGSGPLTDGTRSVSIRTSDGEVLDAFSVVCGLGAAEDLRAEVEALRVEVALLKRAFRRHVNEG
jgi:hypothetical protein